MLTHTGHLVQGAPAGLPSGSTLTGRGPELECRGRGAGQAGQSGLGATCFWVVDLPWEWQWLKGVRAGPGVPQGAGPGSGCHERAETLAHSLNHPVNMRGLGARSRCQGHQAEEMGSGGQTSVSGTEPQTQGNG